MTEVTDYKQLLASGRIDEAEVASERRLESHPDDVAALNVAALGALRRANPLRASELLERASIAAPGDPHIYYYLARARETLGDLDGALDADEKALRFAPDHALARLHYALGLERRRETERSLLHFARALKDAQLKGEWTEAASTPAALRPRVEHAVQAVRNGQRALFQRLLAPLLERHGRAPLERVTSAIRIYIGEQQANYPDPRQKPTFFYVPGMPPSAYFDRRLFPWIPSYEACFSDIRRELEILLPAARGRERVFGSDALEHENLRGYDAAPSWNGYYFYRHGERREENCAACPRTASALDAIPLMRVREHGPEVLYSVFTQGTHLLPHRGVTNARVVSHLALIVPEDCALKVGGEERAWHEGEALVFDDTYEHEAWNRSRQVRVVLIADIWNPHLNPVERDAVNRVISAIGDMRAEVDAT
ncbi:MAG TPA: aspartyl/asparaginyl beta-hydroxylase domain-containing protein [Steroidobacteraceae bacterium]|jgi:aspartate beta-hydroxylase